MCLVPPETPAEGVSVGVTGGSSASSLVLCWVLAQWSLPEQWTSQEPPLFLQEYWVQRRRQWGVDQGTSPWSVWGARAVHH